MSPIRRRSAPGLVRKRCNVDLPRESSSRRGRFTLNVAPRLRRRPCGVLRLRQVLYSAFRRKRRRANCPLFGPANCGNRALRRNDARVFAELRSRPGLWIPEIDAFGGARRTRCPPATTRARDDQPMFCRIPDWIGTRIQSGDAAIEVVELGTVRSLDLNGSNESVATAGNGFDKSGITGIIPKSFSDFQYCHSQALVEFDKGILRPKSISDLFSRNNLPRALHKQQQKSERLFLQAHPHRIARQGAIGRIKHVESKTVACFGSRQNYL